MAIAVRVMGHASTPSYAEASLCSGKSPGSPSFYRCSEGLEADPGMTSRVASGESLRYDEDLMVGTLRRSLYISISLSQSPGADADAGEKSKGSGVKAGDKAVPPYSTL